MPTEDQIQFAMKYLGFDRPTAIRMLKQQIALAQK